MQVTAEQLQAFLRVCDTVCRDYAAGNTYAQTPTFSIEKGTRYARIVRQGTGRSVHCFVDLTNGSVLKAASWKAPAKHARGNLNDADGGASALGPYGAVYLK